MPRIKKKLCKGHSIYDGDTVTVEWETESRLGLKKKIRFPKIRSKEKGSMSAKEMLEKIHPGKSGHSFAANLSSQSQYQ